MGAKSPKETKKAVKKTVAKKSEPKKARQTTAKTPKKTTKKAETKVKKVAKKTAVKNTSAKKSTPKARVKKPTPAKKVSQPRPKKKDTDVVVLPKRMSMRAQEKALVFSREFEKEFYPLALQLAKVSALCFIAVGSVLTFTTIFSDAEICSFGCSAEVISTQEQNTTTETSQLLTTNSVLLLAPLPGKVEGVVEVPIQATGAKEVSASLVFLDASGKLIIPLTVHDLKNDKYAIEIKGDALRSAQYTLKVEVRYEGSERYHTFTLGDFIVYNPEELQKEEPQPKEEDTTFDLLKIEDSVQDEVDEVQKEEVEPREEIVDTEEIILKDQQEERLEDGSVVTIISEEDLRKESLQQEIAAPVFSISAPAKASQIIQVGVNADVSYKDIGFFVRQVNGMNTQFVGTLASGQTVFLFNTLNVPNGTYQLFARAATSDSALKSNAVTIEIFNRENISQESVDPEQERQLLIISTELNKDLYDSFEASETVDESVLKLTEERLREDSDRLDELFKAYAAAQQAEDEALIVSAKDSIQKYRSDIISGALLDENDRYIAEDLDEALQKRLQDFESKVDRFEQVRKERIADNASTDTDQDGISDVDEVVLYGTDPKRADTDGDGFTDGVEITRGYNPLDVSAEAVIVYQSPKEVVGVVKTDKLKINQVTPDIALETASSAERVQTTVRGQGLPNSYVTLYVFSTPTIVTVRTDETGAFEYTFSKELEDGEHQVFAALTDNAGEIVAQSEPFTFIKQAQAFTPVDAEANSGLAQPVAITEITKPDNSYQIAIGMAVLALGIILLMLGLGLRNNKPEEVIITEN